MTARSIGPLGLAGRQSSHRVPWQIRILPPFLSRKHLPSRLAKLRELEGNDAGADPRPGHRVRFAARVRRRRRRPIDRLARHRPARRRRGADVAAGARPAGGHRAGHRPHVGRPGRRRPHRQRPQRLAAAGLVHGCRAAAGRARLAGRRPRRLPRPRPASPAPAVFNASRTELLAQLVGAMAPLEPALVESDARAMVAAMQRRVRRSALVVLLTDLNASALDEGLMSVLPQLSAKHQVLLAAVADPRVDALAAGRADAAEVYDAAAAERARNDRRSIASRLRACGRRRRGRAAGGIGARTGRPLPGDEGHAAEALSGVGHHVGRVARCRRSPRPRPPCGRNGTRSQEGDLGGHADGDADERRQRRRRHERLDQTRPPAARRPGRPRPRPPPGPARPAPGRAAGSRRHHRPAEPHAHSRRPGTPRSVRSARAG